MTDVTIDERSACCHDISEPIEMRSDQYESETEMHNNNDIHTQDHLHRHDRGPDDPGGWPGRFDPAGRRGRRGRGPGRGRGRFGGPGFGGGHRAARGDVRAAILALLNEQPMHGYQVIAELDERTGGVWKPSPGSVYPTLQMLEDEGLVAPDAEGGKKVFHLTDEGRAAAVAAGSAPWEAVVGDAAQVDLRKVVGQLLAASKQVAQTGSPAQIERARVVMNDARKALYGILAEDDETDA
jgi:DNA-binding PadR family transcriptional regulator